MLAANAPTSAPRSGMRPVACTVPPPTCANACLSRASPSATSTSMVTSLIPTGSPLSWSSPFRTWAEPVKMGAVTGPVTWTLAERVPPARSTAGMSAERRLRSTGSTRTSALKRGAAMAFSTVPPATSVAARPEGRRTCALRSGTRSVPSSSSMGADGAGR